MELVSYIFVTTMRGFSFLMQNVVVIVLLLLLTGYSSLFSIWVEVNKDRSQK